MSSVRKAVTVYTLGRFGLFMLVALLITLGSRAAGAPLNGLPLLLASLVVSAIASLFVFARQRQQLAIALAAKRDAKTEQIAQRRARLETDGTASS